jgi:hypothetical protein
MPMRIQKILERMRRPRFLASAVLAALAIVFLLGGYAFRGVWWPRGSGAETGRDQPLGEFRHPLTGVRLEEPAERPQVYGVMVDHSQDAWPQNGVDQAFLVIEAPVEAGIPRLLAFFSSDKQVDKIGPIRSARPYFVDWNNELDALYVHVGGSDAALEQISLDGTFDLNQFWNGNVFWRATDRFAPHNTYTSTDLLASAVAKFRAASKAPFLVYGSWKFQDPPALRPETGVGVMIDYFPTVYRATWKYQPDTNQYRRLQSGLPFAMQNGAVIEAANVAVMVTGIKVIDQVGRREIKTIGEGDAFVFRDGEMIAAKWKKPSQSERLRFYNENGEEILWNPGQTWIEVVDSRDRVIVQK